MSDILASIRKIMAQDSGPAAPPAPGNAAAPELRPPTLEMPRMLARPSPPDMKGEGKPAAEPPPAPPTANAAPVPAPQSPTPPAPALKAEEPVSLDEFLAMSVPAKPLGPAGSAPGIPGTRPKPPRTDDPVTIPLVRPSSPPPPAPAAAELPAEASPVMDETMSERSTLRPGFPVPSLKSPAPAAEAKLTSPSAPAKGDDPGPAAEPQASAAAATPAPSPAKTQAMPAPATVPTPHPMPTKDMAPAPPRPAPSLGDLGSVVPGRFDAAGRMPGDVPPAPPIAGPASGAARGLSPPMAPSATPVRAGPAPIAEIPGADALRRLIADVVPPSAHAPLPTPPRASDDVATEIVLPRAPLAEVTGLKKPTDVADPIPAPKIAEIVKAPEPKVDTSPVAKMPAPEPATAPAPVPAPSPTPASPIAVAPPAPAEAPAAVARMEKPDPAKAATASAALVPAPMTEPAAKSVEPLPPAVRTMDETVIELLRPLLREWLEKNMGRLIEPALKAELEALRTKLDEKPKS